MEESFATNCQCFDVLSCLFLYHFLELTIDLIDNIGDPRALIKAGLHIYLNYVSGQLVKCFICQQKRTGGLRPVECWLYTIRRNSTQ